MASDKSSNTNIVEHRNKDMTGSERAFTFVERAFLIVIALMTVAAAGVEIHEVVSNRTIGLADILLMFLYLEVMGMIAVFYQGEDSSPFVYPIFIAMTALARLIVLQGKDMAPENIVFEAGAILLLAIAAAIVFRGARSR
ncbi:MAG: phosphate-starvation-inducible E [Alphaproteobacteria bacterium]|nr:phosphate-starvation-inducible E [Alphaproteobacteria bacterium]